MVSRRAALFLAMVFGFRLLVVSGALVCTAQGSHAHVAEAGHHGDGPGHGEGGKKTPCNTPDSADCCAAMVSCSLVLASGTVVATAGTPPDAAGEIRQLSSSPLARPHSPDPPPPKS